MQQKVISRPSREAGEPDKFQISTYFPLRTYTAGKVPSCATFPPTVAPLEEDMCAASGSRGSTSPEGITETRRAQTGLGLDRECYVDYKQGNFMDFTVHTRSSLQAPSYRHHPTSTPCASVSELPAKSSNNQDHAGVGVGMGVVRAAETGAAPLDSPQHHVAVVLLQGQ